MKFEMNEEVPQITYDEGKLVYYVNNKEYKPVAERSCEELNGLIYPREKVQMKNFIASISFICVAVAVPLLTQPQLEFNLERLLSIISGFVILIIIALVKLIRVNCNFGNATKIGYLIIPSNNPVLEVDNVGVKLYNGSTLMKNINWREVNFIGVYEKCILFSSSKRDQMFYINSCYKDKLLDYLKSIEYDFLIMDYSI